MTDPYSLTIQALHDRLREEQRPGVARASTTLCGECGEGLCCREAAVCTDIFFETKILR